MAILGFTGQMPVAIGLSWKGDIIANTMTTTVADESYVLANESLTELKVTGLFGGSTRILERKATAKNRLYDDKVNLYVMEPVSSGVVEQFLTIAKGAPLFLELTFTFSPFFEKILEQMTRIDADLHNLANPNDSKPILDTFTHSAGKTVSITYKSETKVAKPLKATLIDSSVAAPPKGSKIPSVKLMLEIDFGKTPAASQQELMRKLIAMDWSKLARFGAPDSKRVDVDIWRENCLRYLANHTDMARGESFRQAILNRHKGKSPKTLATDLRDDLDLHLITANHWGQAREDLKTERHQRLLSDLFGTLHQKTFLSSPVSFARELKGRFFPADKEKIAAIALQYGTGHCGEHSICSFSILRSIMKLPGNLVKACILSGNANIDHAFVVYNVVPPGFFATKTTNPKSNRAVGTEITVFDLRATLAANPAGTGFVMDPYLDKTVMKPTADELLIALNRPDRQKSGKATDFLAFTDFQPLPLPPGTDLRGRPDSIRKSLIPNV
jgi:hypothetical protein